MSNPFGTFHRRSPVTLRLVGALAPVIPRLDGRAGGHEPVHHGEVARLRGQMQRCVPTSALRSRRCFLQDEQKKDGTRHSGSINKRMRLSISFIVSISSGAGQPVTAGGRGREGKSAEEGEVPKLENIQNFN